jgi:hypothetical protein
VDGDKDLDLVVGNYYYQNRLYLNDGAGIFVDATTALMPVNWDYSSRLALGDTDGDGDLDLVESGRLLCNLSRHLAWRGIPRVGKPLTMDLYGPRNGLYLLAVSRLTTSIPIPPYGVLRILPGAIIFQKGGNLDNYGRASVSFNVPSAPVLIGVSVYWQAAVGPATRLTNLEITTFTNL